MVALVYVHLLTMALWFGGLFLYVFVVWPAVASQSRGVFPRGLLCTMAMRTAGWIYLGMTAALASVVAVWIIDPPLRNSLMVGYTLLVTGAAANNVYGSVVAWPRMMLCSAPVAAKEWFWFRVRMGISLVVGLVLYSGAVITAVSHGWR